jgi:hypothetical protein
VQTLPESRTQNLLDVPEFTGRDEEGGDEA